MQIIAGFRKYKYISCFCVIGPSTAMESWIKRKKKDCFNVLYIEVNSNIVYINIH